MKPHILPLEPGAEVEPRSSFFSLSSAIYAVLSLEGDVVSLCGSAIAISERHLITFSSTLSRVSSDSLNISVTNHPQLRGQLLSVQVKAIGRSNVLNHVPSDVQCLIPKVLKVDSQNRNVDDLMLLQAAKEEILTPISQELVTNQFTTSPTESTPPKVSVIGYSSPFAVTTDEFSRESQEAMLDFIKCLRGHPRKMFFDDILVEKDDEGRLCLLNFVPDVHLTGGVVVVKSGGIRAIGLVNDVSRGLVFVSFWNFV
ncbi:hypothetical protein P9112_012601 [Eukaryota sp. TZLM1-RC]